METIVLGISDTLLGQKLVAFICPMNSDISKTDILNACQEKLSKTQMPSEIYFLKSLPKNNNGKVNHAKCVEGMGGRVQGAY